MAYRPNAERTIVKVATWRGRRLKLRYRAVTRTTTGSSAAALNLRNLASWRMTATAAAGSCSPDWPFGPRSASL